mmetsp:Transcript_27592/g.62808  ORF Transcript_27592/g.62808 Transcript_27592/m.62808 type:complete len:169 (-) Transcript_27592:144-650(-)
MAILGGLFQFIWFSLSVYLLGLILIDIVRLQVFFHEAPFGTASRCMVFCIALCMAIEKAPAWTGSCLPFHGYKEALFNRCKCFKKPQFTPILMFFLMFAAVGRARQYELAFDQNNVSWGWLVCLIFLFAILNTIFFILNTIVWVLTGCKSEKKEGGGGKKKGNKKKDQ